MDPPRPQDARSPPRTSSGQGAPAWMVSMTSSPPAPAPAPRSSSTASHYLPSTTPASQAAMHTSCPQSIQTVAVASHNTTARSWPSQADATLLPPRPNAFTTAYPYIGYNNVYATSSIAPNMDLGTTSPNPLSMPLAATAPIPPSMTPISDGTLPDGETVPSTPGWISNFEEYMDFTLNSPICSQCGNTRVDQYSTGDVTPENSLYQSLDSQTAGQTWVDPYQSPNTPHQVTPPPGGRAAPINNSTGSATCPVCQKVFSGQWGHRNLARHQEQDHIPYKSADGRKSFRCGVCKRTYRRGDARLAHERKNHPELKRPKAIRRRKTGATEEET